MLASALLCLGQLGCGGEVEPSPDTFGPHAVGHTVVTLSDVGEPGRTVKVQVWYPAQEDPSASIASYAISLFRVPAEIATSSEPVADEQRQFPLVIYSHGFNAISVQAPHLLETLASHGFVVAAPEHTGNAQFAGTDDSFDETVVHRAADLARILDAFGGARGDLPENLVSITDASTAGVVGHSMGGHTAVASAVGAPGAEPDPRVRAIAPISAPVEGYFTNEQLRAAQVPTLFLGGTEDTNVPVSNSAFGLETMLAARPRYRVDVIGASHEHFASVCLFGDLLLDLGITQERWPALGAGQLVDIYDETCGPDAFPIAEAARLTNLFVVSFFKAHVGGDDRYRAYLEPGYAETLSDIYFERVE